MSLRTQGSGFNVKPQSITFDGTTQPSSVVVNGKYIPFTRAYTLIDAAKVRSGLRAMGKVGAMVLSNGSDYVVTENHIDAYHLCEPDTARVVYRIVTDVEVNGEIARLKAAKVAREAAIAAGDQMAKLGMRPLD